MRKEAETGVGVGGPEDTWSEPKRERPERILPHRLCRDRCPATPRCLTLASRTVRKETPLL